MGNISEILKCITEVERLKRVLRKTKPVGLDRYENSAEHSWHVCFCALVLQEFSKESIDIEKVLKMLVIHDLGEVVVGDTIVYDKPSGEENSEERDGLVQVLEGLDEGLQTEILELWDEFEARETAEAKYAKAIDRIPPLLHNLKGEGHSWKENQIPKAMVYAVNSRIGEGMPEVWEALKRLLKEAETKGILE